MSAEEEYFRVAHNLNFKHAGNVTVDAGLSGTGKYCVWPKNVRAASARSSYMVMKKRI